MREKKKWHGVCGCVSICGCVNVLCCVAYMRACVGCTAYMASRGMRSVTWRGVRRPLAIMIARKRVRKLPVLVRALARIAPIAFTEPVAFGWRYASETFAAMLFEAKGWVYYSFKIVLVTTLATAAEVAMHARQKQAERLSEDGVEGNPHWTSLCLPKQHEKMGNHIRMYVYGHVFFRTPEVL